MKNLFMVIAFLWTGAALAHPVSFEGSKGIMGYHSPQLTHFQLNYSATYRFAVGAHHFAIPNSSPYRFANFLSANFLLKRWNGPSYQGNIYAVLGVGHSQMREQSVGAGLGKLQFDIEDRKYYFLTSYSQIQSEKGRELTDFVIRAGLAPYVGDFKDIHSWLILEWRENQILNEEKFEDLTPFLRVFYRNLLFEIGQSFKGITRFNYIVHF